MGAIIEKHPMSAFSLLLLLLYQFEIFVYQVTDNL